MKNELEETIADLVPSLANLFAEIAAQTADRNGITRDAYGPIETAAGDLLIDFSRRHDLVADYDPVGNVNVTAPGKPADDVVIIASHIDSVPLGGNYDGLAGVIAGIATLAALHSVGAPSRHAVRVVGFRGEESPWFGSAYLGSKLFTGQITLAEAKAMRRFDTGKTLVEHLHDIGVPESRIGGDPLVPFDRIRAYLELHIEQGPLLQDLDKPVGIATAVRGNIRYPFARCIGQYAHSAAVPRRLRSDAVMATSKLIAYADDRWRKESEAHDDLVFTCGIFQTDGAEHSMTKVPGEVRFSLNIGSIDDGAMDRMHMALISRAEELAREHNVRFDLGPRVGTGAIGLDDGVAAVLRRGSQAVGLDGYAMPTVGHDAAMFARRGVPAGIILIRNANGSHNPDEHMEIADFALGLQVLAQSAHDLASR
jgi:beta-ureidopropionase / N-carbamoyl-L-amino-acid hydrolase